MCTCCFDLAIQEPGGGPPAVPVARRASWTTGSAFGRQKPRRLFRQLPRRAFGILTAENWEPEGTGGRFPRARGEVQEQVGRQGQPPSVPSSCCQIALHRPGAALHPRLRRECQAVVFNLKTPGREELLSKMKIGRKPCESLVYRKGRPSGSLAQPGEGTRRGPGRLRGAAALPATSPSITKWLRSSGSFKITPGLCKTAT